jgi:hypothetical protein
MGLLEMLTSKRFKTMRIASDPIGIPSAPHAEIDAARAPMLHG